MTISAGSTYVTSEICTIFTLPFEMTTSIWVFLGKDTISWSSVYLGSHTPAAWSLSRIESPLLSSLSGTGALASLFFWPCSKLLAMSWYLFLNAFRKSLYSSVPKHLTVGVWSEFSGTMGYQKHKEERGFSFHAHLIKCYIQCKVMVSLGPTRDFFLHV